ncbi:hypothetical protein OG352_27620 [Streptomyces sp. NBC_01485]|uniref:hypothetical protein n=1 Tax=Streptomyces sp. NBC_01485 TaxID=2903884 RepID=UPI002E31A8E0|nr:hypothetical protein [Streptomyces sp. NBC_01485]
MEQRIGSSSQPLEGEPLKGAGFDPAFIPGLTTPPNAEPEDAKPAKKAGEADDVDEAEASDVSDDRVVEKAEDASSEESAGDETAEDESEPVDGPVFEASDRRARIAADAKGVRLRLDEEACEFRWDEIGAIETETPRFGKRYTITVHTPDRRWYPIEIEATARARFKEWDEQLDAVLDAYFDDEAEAEAEEAGAEVKEAEVKGAEAAKDDD